MNDFDLIELKISKGGWPKNLKGIKLSENLMDITWRDLRDPILEQTNQVKWLVIWEFSYDF